MAKSKRQIKVKSPDVWACEVFEQDFTFFLQWDYEEFKEYINSRGGNLGDKSSGCDGVTYTGSYGIGIWIGPDAGADVLVHECVHASHFALRHRGIHPNSDNAEVTAYLTGALFRMATRFLNQR